MYKVENFGLNEFNFELPFECEIHHCFPKAQPLPNRFSVLIHYMEPSQLKWSNEEVRKYHSIFNLILTNEESLMDLPNTKFSLFGGKTVSSLSDQKFFDVSFLYSGGIGHEHIFKGYADRRIIWNNKNKLTIPNSFYTSVYRPPKDINNYNQYPFDKKDELFKSMFSIIVENDYQNNYFSEKLIDCISSFSIPIYLGSPNIQKYFCVDGMIIPNSIDDLIDAVNSITKEDYYRRMNAMAENYEKSKMFWDIPKILKGYILNSFNN